MGTGSSEMCPLCGGTKGIGKTAYVQDYGTGVVVVRNVPAIVCTKCGADWLDDTTAARVERLAENAKARGSQVEVVVYD